MKLEIFGQPQPAEKVARLSLFPGPNPGEIDLCTVLENGLPDWYLLRISAEGITRHNHCSGAGFPCETQGRIKLLN